MVVTILEAAAERLVTAQKTMAAAAAVGEVQRSLLNPQGLAVVVVFLSLRSQ